MCKYVDNIKMTACLFVDYLDFNIGDVPVSVAARSKAQICGRSPAEIVGSNSVGCLDVFLL
jgi:hypothetical protein